MSKIESNVFFEKLFFEPNVLNTLFHMFEKKDFFKITWESVFDVYRSIYIFSADDITANSVLCSLYCNTSTGDNQNIIWCLESLLAEVTNPFSGCSLQKRSG